MNGGIERSVPNPPPECNSTEPDCSRQSRIALHQRGGGILGGSRLCGVEGGGQPNVVNTLQKLFFLTNLLIGVIIMVEDGEK